MGTKSNLKKQNKSIVNTKNIWFLIPILIALAIVPMIVYMKAEYLQGIVKDYWKGTDSNTDFFSYYKAMWIVICAIAGSIILLLRMYMRNMEIKKSRIYIPAAVYCGFIILSTLLSKYPNVSLLGFVDRHEGMLVLVSYLLLFFITFNFVDNEKAVKWMIYALAGSALIIGGIGFFQYIGYDFFASNFGRHLILPKQYDYMAPTLHFEFGKNRVYSTLYNPNYVASYVVLIIPIITGIMIFIKNIIIKVLSGLILFLMFFNLLGSESRAGFAATGIIILLICVAFRKHIIKNRNKIIVALISLFVIFMGANILSGWRFTNSIKSTYNNIKSGLNVSHDKYYINDLTLKDNAMVIQSNYCNLGLSIKNANIEFIDQKGNAIPITKSGNGYKLTGAKYDKISFTLPKQGTLDIDFGGKTIYLYNLKEGLRIAGVNGKADTSHKVESFGFKGNEKFFDGRGYIWSRTIPMLKKATILGYGPDLYAVYFPQNDYVGKLNTFNTVFELVDKPHNLYLGIAISSGVLSLIAVIVLLLMYFITSIKIYIKGNYSTFVEMCGATILISMFGYCILGIFNDSSVSVSPVFWILFGLGMACNFIVKRQRQIETK